jgi:hypothetical protein
MPEINNERQYIFKLFDYQNEKLSSLEEKVDKLSNKLFFYIGVSSVVASVVSFLLSKL